MVEDLGDRGLKPPLVPRRQVLVLERRPMSTSPGPSRLVVPAVGRRGVPARGGIRRPVAAMVPAARPMGRLAGAAWHRDSAPAGARAVRGAAALTRRPKGRNEPGRGRNAARPHTTSHRPSSRRVATWLTESTGAFNLASCSGALQNDFLERPEAPTAFRAARMARLLEGLRVVHLRYCVESRHLLERKPFWLFGRAHHVACGRVGAKVGSPPGSAHRHVHCEDGSLSLLSLALPFCAMTTSSSKSAALLEFESSVPSCSNRDGQNRPAGRQADEQTERDRETDTQTASLGMFWAFRSMMLLLGAANSEQTQNTRMNPNTGALEASLVSIGVKASCFRTHLSGRRGSD